jgi:hypothetical protein
MNKMIIAAGFALAMAATPAIAAEDPDVMAPIHAFVDGMTTGDIAKAAGAFTASPIIIDEFPPYVWSGASAFQTWGGDYGQDAQANQITDGKLSLGKVHRSLVEGDKAYVVTDADYAFKKAGTPVVEHAVVTFTLDKTAAGWRIASWAFAY